MNRCRTMQRVGERRRARRRWLWLACALLPVLGAPALAAQATNAALRAFLRFEMIGRDEGHLDTVVRSYQRPNGVTVTLFAAVHVADRAYYEKLQRMFEECDALLYEMIRDREASSTVQVDTENPLSQLQLGMKSLLGLEFQLDRIDYSRPNFVHADLDPEAFFRLQRQRGESILGLMLRVILEEQSRQANTPQGALGGYQLLFALLSADRAHSLKLVLGQQMDQMEAMLAGIDQGPDGQGSVLVRGRNEHALQVLQEQLRAGKRRLGIFYGAGHMPDFERRLQALGFQRSTERWLVAWDVRRRQPAPSPSP